MYPGPLYERTGSDQMSGVRRSFIPQVFHSAPQWIFFGRRERSLDTLLDKLDLCSVIQASRSMYSRFMYASLSEGCIEMIIDQQ